MVPQGLSRHLPAFLFALAAVILAASVLAAPATQTAAHRAPRSAAIAAPVADGTRVSVIVQHAGSAAAARAAVFEAGGTVSREFTIIPALQAELPAAAIDALAADPAVLVVSPNHDVVSTGKKSSRDSGACASADGKPAHQKRQKKAEREASLPCADEPEAISSSFTAAIGAPAVWAEGVTGAGIGIAIVDSGLNGGGKDDFGSRLVADVSVIHGKRDLYGHGTLVASIAAGDGSHSDERYMGVAPGADVISVKVGNYDGGASSADVIAGLEWVLAHRERYNIRVVNLSLSEPVATSYLTNPLNAAVERLWLSGVVVVAAQGNRGSDEYAADHAPGNDPYVISVGAFSDNGTVSADDDYLKSWSSRGVSHDGFAKPDLVAPGSKLIGSVGQGSSYLYRDNPAQQVGTRYVRFSGTSAAAPVVSGVVALMLERDPGLTPGEVKARLIASSNPMVDSDAPRVNAFAAVFSSADGDANAGIEPSYWLRLDGRALSAGQASADGINWDGINWDGIHWDGINWDGIHWDGIHWDGINWE